MKRDKNIKPRPESVSVLNQQYSSWYSLPVGLITYTFEFIDTPTWINC